MKTEYICEKCVKKFEAEKDAMSCEKSHEAREQRRTLEKKSEDIISELINRHLRAFHTLPALKIDEELVGAAVGDTAGRVLELLKRATAAGKRKPAAESDAAGHELGQALAAILDVLCGVFDEDDDEDDDDYDEYDEEEEA